MKNTSISLFKAIVKNLDDIEIKFQGNKIDENLILFKGTFFNNGNIDIEKSIIHKPLEIELPANYHWVRHKIIDSSEGLEVNSQTNNNKLSFEWDLLKEGEYFTFDSLVEYKSKAENNDEYNVDIGKGLIRKMKINHRITNLKKVNKEDSIPRPMPFGASIFFSLLLLAFVSGGFYISFGQFFFPSYEVLYEVAVDSQIHFVKFSAVNENEITLTDNSGNEIKRFPKNELIPLLSNNIKITKAKINYWTLSIIGFFSIVYFIIWIAMMVLDFRDRKLYKKLKNVAEKYDHLDFEERRQVGFKLFEFRFK